MQLFRVTTPWQAGGGTAPPPGAPGSANLIVNGSFEDVPASYGSGGSAADWMNTQELAGWPITRDNIDIVASYWQQVIR